MKKVLIFFLLPGIFAYLITSIYLRNTDSSLKSEEKSCRANIQILRQRALFQENKIVKKEREARELIAKTGKGDIALDKTLCNRFLKEDVVSEEVAIENETIATIEESKGEEVSIRDVKEDTKIETEITKKKKDEKLDAFPRFSTFPEAPTGAILYGIDSGKYKDFNVYLDSKRVSRSRLFAVSNNDRFRIPFFYRNNGKRFKGRVYIKSRPERVVFGMFSFASDKAENKFTTLNTSQIWEEEKGVISTQYERILVFKFSAVPWRYNSSSRSMSLLTNDCSVDGSFDMGLKDFFYLSRHEKIVGNYYCQKSSSKSWTLVATFIYDRVK